MRIIPLIVVLGPTASGKTALAVELAKRLDGEVVSADSMQIYKEMQIATAKPTYEEMQGIKHHLIDFLEPSDSFSVADYVAMAKTVIEDIYKRGKTPILCGGTGLYISSLIDNIRFDDSSPDDKLRRELNELANKKGGEYLLEMLREFDPESAEKLHPNNIPRIIRAIEIYKITGSTMSQAQANSRQCGIYDLCLIGINYYDRHMLYDRINLRVDKMMEAGLLEEARAVLSAEGMKTSAQAIGYKELSGYFSGDKSLAECIDKLKQETRHYAKRQLTWFRRDERINWIYADTEAGFAGVLNKALEIIKASGVLEKE